MAQIGIMFPRLRGKVTISDLAEIEYEEKTYKDKNKKEHTVRVVKNVKKETPMVLTISAVKEKNVFFKETPKVLKMNMATAKQIAEATGSDDTDNWNEKQIEIYFDKTITFGEVNKGGIRVRSVGTKTEK